MTLTGSYLSLMTFRLPVDAAAVAVSFFISADYKY
jgi:hypothetical protein